VGAGLTVRGKQWINNNTNHQTKNAQVVKIGTSSLIHEGHRSINLSNLARVCEAVKQLHTEGHYVVLVSSGAIGVGCQRLGLAARPARIAQKQALAAVGQVHLMRYYDDFFGALGLVRWVVRVVMMIGGGGVVVVVVVVALVVMGRERGVCVFL
jgi:glutamate 5-kinase